MFKLKRADTSIYAVYLNSVPFIQNAGIELYSTEAVKIQLLKEYKDYTDVFSEEKTDKMPDFVHIEHLIFIKKDKDVSFKSIYLLSVNELCVLHNYLDLSFVKGWIQYSESSADAPILFVLKKDGGLYLYVNYWGLNQITVWNRHSLPLIFKTLNRLAEARRYTKLNLHDVYHYISVKRKDQ